MRLLLDTPALLWYLRRNWRSSSLQVFVEARNRAEALAFDSPAGGNPLLRFRNLLLPAVVVPGEFENLACKFPLVGCLAKSLPHRIPSDVLPLG